MSLILLTIIYVSFIPIKKLAPSVSPYLLTLNKTTVVYISAMVVEFSNVIVIKSCLCQFGENIMEVRKGKTR